MLSLNGEYMSQNHVFQGLTSAEVALVVICVLIVVIFVALAAFLYCTGRLIGCCGIGDKNNKNKKKGTDPNSSAEARKKAEAEKRLRDIRCVIKSCLDTILGIYINCTHYGLYGTNKIQ